MTYMVGASERFNPTFDNGGFWKYYRDIERQLEDFLVYVPFLEANQGIYSFRLANIILNIGAHIDSAFKEIARNPPFETKYPEILKKSDGKPKKRITIQDYYPIAEELNLSKQKVIFKRLPFREKLCPFAQYQKVKKENGKDCIRLPYWWNAYNNIKHRFGESFTEAKLITVRDALAGAFLLNVANDIAAKSLFKRGYLKPKYLPAVIFEEKYDKFRGLEQHKPRPTWEPIDDAFTVETSLFLYDYEEAKTLKQQNRDIEKK